MEDRDTLPLCIVERFHFTLHTTRMACRTVVIVSVRAGCKQEPLCSIYLSEYIPTYLQKYPIMSCPKNGNVK